MRAPLWAGSARPPVEQDRKFSLFVCVYIRINVCINHVNAGLLPLSGEVLESTLLGSPIGTGGARPPEEERKKSLLSIRTMRMRRSLCIGARSKKASKYEDDDGYLRLRVVRAPLGTGGAGPPTRRKGKGRFIVC